MHPRDDLAEQLRRLQVTQIERAEEERRRADRLEMKIDSMRPTHRGMFDTIAFCLRLLLQWRGDSSTLVSFVPSQVGR